MLKRTITVIVFTLLVGCQTARQNEFRAACPRIEVPSFCGMDLSKPGCSQVSQAVSACAQFLDRTVTAQQQQEASAKGMPRSSYENPGAPKLLIGFKDTGTSSVAIYVDSSSLKTYERSLDQAKDLVDSQVRRYSVAMQAYLARAAAGSTRDVAELEAASALLQKLKSPLKHAAAAGEPIARFYSSQPTFDYQSAITKVSNSFDRRNDVLRRAETVALNRHESIQPFPPFVMADVAVGQFRSLAEDTAEWPRKLMQDKAKGEGLAAELARQRARQAADRYLERQYHQRREAPSEPVRSPGFSGGGCSCSGGNVCYGPRGGRYCITSGGNKRYGI